MALAIALFVKAWARKCVTYVMVLVLPLGKVTTVVIHAGVVTALEESNVFFVVVAGNAINAKAQGT